MAMLLGASCLGVVTALIATDSLWAAFVFLVTTLILALFSWSTR